MTKNTSKYNKKSSFYYLKVSVIKCKIQRRISFKIRDITKKWNIRFRARPTKLRQLKFPKKQYHLEGKFENIRH